MKTLIPGDIVIHKLTRQKMLVLSKEGYGFSYIEQVRVRLKDLSEKLLDRDELLWKDPDCMVCNWKPKWSGTTSIELHTCTCDK